MFKGLCLITIVSFVGIPMHVLAAACTPETTAEKHILWGDLHIHTGYSMDAYAFGARLDPAAAYRFARGAPQTLPGGVQYALDRPLDFAAVTDHAETFGVMNLCTVRDSDHPYCRGFVEASDGKSRRAFDEFFLPALYDDSAPEVCAGRADCRGAQVDLWARTIQAAEDANEPCAFTAFVANEWSATPRDLHHHRNLIFASANVPRVPINAIDEPTAPDMWQALDARCKADEGCRVLAIPHNSNLSLGGSFEIETLSDDDLRKRARYERLMEIHQHKGQSECFPGVGFTDEACDWEIRLPTPLIARADDLSSEELAQVASGYARAALAKGLANTSSTGFNPLQLGFIGSTDTHSARPGAVDEASWPGATGSFDSDPDVRHRLSVNNPGGLAAVWTTQNTREAIFAALERRETYATSGTRIALRFFQSNDQEDLCTSDAEPVDATLMGGTMVGSAAPTFYVRAMKDRAPLSRIDLIKLWVTNGQVRQSITPYLPDDEGANELCARFVDKQYDAGTPALWYARVLEVSTARWRSFTGKSDETVQERAWSSPIWNNAN